MKSWRQRDKAFSFEGKQNFSAGHILEAAIGLSPIPLLAEDPGNMLSALAPMTVDGGLDRRDVLLGNGSFSDGKRQHPNYISERTRGRQQKMQGSQKKSLVSKFASDGPDLWVEMKNRGLKISEILDSSTY